MKPLDVLDWMTVLMWTSLLPVSDSTVIFSFLYFNRIFPREYLLQHIHLYSMADLQQVHTRTLNDDAVHISLLPGKAFNT